AFGVPTVTSDKSGFGQWISGNFDDDIYACGVKVIARTDSNYEIAAEAIACQIATQRDATAAEIAEAREAAVATAAKADWALFIEHYDKAFEVAQTNASERQIKH
ncbi:MAG: glycosyl transferase, partial [Muribaculaceae bacterium]|nr:glycosyl transferase [Muribaculaceae bacterium]